MGRLLGHAFCGVLPAFLAHWSGTDFVKCLNDHAVLGVSLEVRDLQVMLLCVFLREINSLKHVRLVRRLSVSNVVAQNFTVPVLAWRRFPRYLMEFTFIAHIFPNAYTAYNVPAITLRMLLKSSVYGHLQRNCFAYLERVLIESIHLDGSWRASRCFFCGNNGDRVRRIRCANFVFSDDSKVIGGRGS